MVLVNKCGSFEHVSFVDSDLVFCFSTCFSQDPLNLLAESVAKQCQPNTLVITTDYMLHHPSLKLVEKVEGRRMVLAQWWVLDGICSSSDLVTLLDTDLCLSR